MRDEINTERCRELADKEPTTFSEDQYTELEELVWQVRTTVNHLDQARVSLHKASHEGVMLLSGREQRTVNDAEYDIEDVLEPYAKLLRSMEQTLSDADEYLYG